MTKPAPHTMSLTKHGRGPFLEAQWVPVCTVCGPISSRTDLDTARTEARRHPHNVEAARLAKTKSTSEKEKQHDNHPA